MPSFAVFMAMFKLITSPVTQKHLLVHLKKEAAFDNETELIEYRYWMKIVSSHETFLQVW